MVKIDKHVRLGSGLSVTVATFLITKELLQWQAIRSTCLPIAGSVDNGGQVHLVVFLPQASICCSGLQPSSCIEGTCISCPSRPSPLVQDLWLFILRSQLRSSCAPFPIHLETTLQYASYSLVPYDLRGTYRSPSIPSP